MIWTIAVAQKELEQRIPAPVLHCTFYFYRHMVNNINRRLYRNAIISSPIIGLYGATPIFLFNVVPGKWVVFAAIGITANVFIFWLINIYLLKRYAENAESPKRYVLSYLLTLLVHSLFIFFRQGLPQPPVAPSAFYIYPLMSIIGINTLVLIISNSILLAQKKLSAELEVEQLKVSHLEAQKQILMQQLQPHFLFNTLSVMKSLIKENPDEAENYAVKLSDFLRYSVQIHKSDLVTLEQELKFTEDYLELQKVRFGDSLFCRITIPVAAQEMQLPAYALQTLVENAIKHNSFTEKNPLHISISYGKETVTVCNKKSPKPYAETMGTGLNNLNGRYKIITGKEIVVNDSSAEFCVSVKLIAI